MKEKDYITYNETKYDIIKTAFGWVADTRLEQAILAAMNLDEESAKTAQFTDEFFVFYIEPDMMERYNLDEINEFLKNEIGD